MNMIERVARAIAISNDIDPDWGNPPFWKHYVENAKAAIEAIIVNVHHEAQDTEFDAGFEAFRNILKETINK